MSICSPITYHCPKLVGLRFGYCSRFAGLMAPNPVLMLVLLVTTCGLFPAFLVADYLARLSFILTLALPFIKPFLPLILSLFRHNHVCSLFKLELKYPKSGEILVGIVHCAVQSLLNLLRSWKFSCLIRNHLPEIRGKSSPYC